MPYCPKCRDEFQNWVKICPDCNVALVDKLPEPKASSRKKPDDPIVHIADAPDEPTANIWARILEDNDIQCFVKAGGMGVANYITKMILIHEIYVLKSQEKKAMKIISPLLES